jgi:hypothetical protein
MIIINMYTRTIKSIASISYITGTQIAPKSVEALSVATTRSTFVEALVLIYLMLVSSRGKIDLVVRGRLPKQV